MTWSGAPEFASGKMPTQLNGVSVKVNGEAAYVCYISPNQINVLTPLNLEAGPVAVVVTNGTASTAPLNVTAATDGAVLPPLRRESAHRGDSRGRIVAGPGIDVRPGYAFSPARPGETIVLYATGFGLPQTAS